MKILGKTWLSGYIINWQSKYVSVKWRRNDGWMGRFGGGWNWKLGIQVGGATAIISLVVLEVRISRKPLTITAKEVNI